MTGNGTVMMNRDGPVPMMNPNAMLNGKPMMMNPNMMGNITSFK